MLRPGRRTAGPRNGAARRGTAQRFDHNEGKGNLMAQTPAFLMTGQDVAVRDLQPHVIFHLTPHRVDGRLIGRRERDVEVERVYQPDPRHIAVDWLDAPYPGSSERRRGTTVYDRFSRVTVIGRRGGWAEAQWPARIAAAQAGLADIEHRIAEARRAAAACAGVRAW
jgi:hypothetical protein